MFITYINMYLLKCMMRKYDVVKIIPRSDFKRDIIFYLHCLIFASYISLWNVTHELYDQTLIQNLLLEVIVALQEKANTSSEPDVKLNECRVSGGA